MVQHHKKCTSRRYHQQLYQIVLISMYYLLVFIVWTDLMIKNLESIIKLWIDNNNNFITNIIYCRFKQCIIIHALQNHIDTHVMKNDHSNRCWPHYHIKSALPWYDFRDVFSKTLRCNRFWWMAQKNDITWYHH